MVPFVLYVYCIVLSCSEVIRLLLLREKISILHISRTEDKKGVGKDEEVHSTYIHRWGKKCVL